MTAGQLTGSFVFVSLQYLMTEDIGSTSMSVDSRDTVLLSFHLTARIPSSLMFWSRRYRTSSRLVKKLSAKMAVVLGRTWYLPGQRQSGWWHPWLVVQCWLLVFIVVVIVVVIVIDLEHCRLHAPPLGRGAHVTWAWNVQIVGRWDKVRVFHIVIFLLVIVTDGRNSVNERSRKIAFSGFRENRKSVPKVQQFVEEVVPQYSPSALKVISDCPEDMWKYACDVMTTIGPFYMNKQHSKVALQNSVLACLWTLSYQESYGVADRFNMTKSACISMNSVLLSLHICLTTFPGPQGKPCIIQS
ncbi:hypothetical protein F7725_016150 [Dissostichus mawsoni]|uniref:Uncharacterized protein n=1 Tax=Dissostichus mawsoni TaxID=36200 RepID=A0A7J5Y3U8_DISMA|nr:hypothetical protein F7725_016150 [Dissostichus mawsoni]